MIPEETLRLGDVFTLAVYERQAPLQRSTDEMEERYSQLQLLQERDKKLFEIAKSVGYESDAAFSKACKRVLGVRPGKHRRNSAQPPQPAGCSSDAR